MRVGNSEKLQIKLRWSSILIFIHFLKVSWFRNVFLVSSILPSSEQKIPLNYNSKCFGTNFNETKIHFLLFCYSAISIVFSERPFKIKRVVHDFKWPKKNFLSAEFQANPTDISWQKVVFFSHSKLGTTVFILDGL